MHVYISDFFSIYILHLFIYNVNYMNTNIDNIYVNIFKSMCVYLYIHIKYTQNTHIFCVGLMIRQNYFIYLY